MNRNISEISKAGQKVMIVKDTSVVVPGLGLSALHEQGYTGKVVNVAVIDGPLRAEHEEFGDRLAHYETIGSVNEADLYHGTTVASVFVGKQVWRGARLNNHEQAWLECN